MVYLKKKKEKRITIEQLKFQTKKAFTKAAKIGKGTYIQKLIRKLSGVDSSDEGLKESTLHRVQVTKDLSHVILGERLMKRLFGQYVEPFASKLERETEETIAASKRVVEIQAEYTIKLRDLNEYLSRLTRTKSFQERAEQRKSGFFVDKYGGRQDLDVPSRSKADSVDKNYQNQDVGKRIGEQNDRVNIEHKRLRRSSSNYSIREPFIPPVAFRGTSDGDSKALEQSLHPSWVAKKMLKEKAAKVNVNISLAAIKAKKIVFSEDD